MSRRAEKNTTGDHRSIDIRRWHRDGLLSAGRYLLWRWTRNGQQTASIGVHVEAESVNLIYTHSRLGAESHALDYSVDLDWTPCNYGGVRPWFRCPASGCGRRAAILYCAGIFACRKCLHLAYESQRETPHDRALGKAQNIRMKLGGSGSMAEEFPDKPKGMHWQTYWRLCRKYEEADSHAIPPWLLRLIR